MTRTPLTCWTVTAMSDLLIVLGLMVLVILSSAWWPAMAERWWLWQWRRQCARDRRKWVLPAWTGPDSPQTPVPVDDPPADDDPCELCAGCQDEDGLMHCDGRDPYCDCTCGWREEWATEDDEWVAELHSINQLGKFGDLTRPIAQQTHYEVEAVIRQLGIPEWIPERWRVAA